MKTVDFIRKHGWTAVIAAVKSTTAEETAAFESKDVIFLDEKNPMLGVNIKVYAIPYLDVKKFTDAYELVQKRGGLDEAKDHTMVLALIEEHEQLKQLQKAIHLVEEVGECNE